MFAFPLYSEQVSGQLGWWHEWRTEAFTAVPVERLQLAGKYPKEKEISMRLQNKPNFAVPLKHLHTACFSNTPYITVEPLQTRWGTLAVQGQVLQGCSAPVKEFPGSFAPTTV